MPCITSPKGSINFTLKIFPERINKYLINIFFYNPSLLDNKMSFFFNFKIWFDYFDCIVQLASDPCLQLERFNETKRNGVLLKYQDMRIKAAVEIKKMWYNLGIYQNPSDLIFVNLTRIIMNFDIFFY